MSDIPQSNALGIVATDAPNHLGEHMKIVEPRSPVSESSVQASGRVIQGTLTEAEAQAIAATEAKLQRKRMRAAANHQGSQASGAEGSARGANVPQAQRTAPVPDSGSVAPATNVQESVAPESGVPESSALEPGPAPTFAGRRAPKDEQKRAVFNALQSIYFVISAEVRAEGKVVEPSLSPHIRANLQKDFWIFMKNTIGDTVDSDQLMLAAKSWADQSYTLHPQHF